MLYSRCHIENLTRRFIRCLFIWVIHLIPHKYTCKLTHTNTNKHTRTRTFNNESEKEYKSWKEMEEYKQTNKSVVSMCSGTCVSTSSIEILCIALHRTAAAAALISCAQIKCKHVAKNTKAIDFMRTWESVNFIRSVNSWELNANAEPLMLLLLMLLLRWHCCYA